MRDNILWGKAYQFSWYTKVVEACALKQDFAQLARGDLTQVGEGGVTLSGGQRARVALARAVYQVWICCTRLRYYYYFYRVSSKTVPTWLFALLSASTHANFKSWDVFEKFRKFAT